jgi:hypothetical protein
VIIDVSISEEMHRNVSVETSRPLKHIGKAMLVSSSMFDLTDFKPRPDFDLIIPPFKYGENPPELWSKLPSLLPIRRKYLISYQETDLGFKKDDLKNIIEEPLNLINDDKTSDKVIIDFHCQPKSDLKRFCGTSESRGQILLKSTFALILTSSKISDLHRRLTETLESGAIPVFLCHPDCTVSKN